MRQASNKISNLITDPLTDFLNDLKREREKGRLKRKTVQKARATVLGIRDSPEFAHLGDGVFAQDLVVIAEQLDSLNRVEHAITTDIAHAEQILRARMCFDFIGASGKIPRRKIDDFNQEMQSALELQFSRESTELDVAVTEVTLEKQRLIFDHEKSQQRDSDDGKRNLRFWKKAFEEKKRSVVGILVGLRCNCKETDPASDAFDGQGIPPEDEVHDLPLTHITPNNTNGGRRRQLVHIHHENDENDEDDINNSQDEFLGVVPSSRQEITTQIRFLQQPQQQNDASSATTTDNQLAQDLLDLFLDTFGESIFKNLDAIIQVPCTDFYTGDELDQYLDTELALLVYVNATTATTTTTDNRSNNDNSN
eukprot:CAMPEP_0118690568 /NCGR_PEP_ID=MMETSP0800-20121206/10191_1 /TAXON_ID=210618 ORGANISM="Striatella unipunctata, Strain CCMP2910" /NCGR_SAMPLE_ID=MMETSP0800 /ASSEMBLY_ACC=CAM_ASM_000638 /LENGTH=365 /DNA_ID=CAMNT_0006588239 /DNA_START=148 /DNA_END=1246 /DNA_ORIENTATION=-